MPNDLASFANTWIARESLDLMRKQMDLASRLFRRGADEPGQLTAAPVLIMEGDAVPDDAERLQDRARQIINEIHSQLRMAPEILGIEPNIVFLSHEDAHALSFLRGSVPKMIHGLTVVQVAKGDQPTPRVAEAAGYRPSAPDVPVAGPTQRKIELPD